MKSKKLLTEDEFGHLARCAVLSNGTDDRLVVFGGVPLLYCCDSELPREATIADLILIKGMLTSALLATDELISLVRQGSLVLGEKLEVKK